MNSLTLECFNNVCLSFSNLATCHLGIMRRKKDIVVPVRMSNGKSILPIDSSLKKEWLMMFIFSEILGDFSPTHFSMDYFVILSQRNVL